MKKERIFYLDFIRALSIIMIITFHFSVGFMKQSSAFYLHFFGMGIWGVLGVALFFMISGASLMYNYGDELDLKKYYKKRFLGIYPIYWIAYSIVFLYSFCKFKGLVWSGPIWKLIFSFLGMDGYLNVYTETFGLIGDWFVGCIVLVYIVFPALRRAMKEFPKLFLILSTIIFGLTIFLSDFTMPLNRNFLVAVYTFLIGMYYIEWKKEIKLWHAVIMTPLGILFLKLGYTPELLPKVLFVSLAAYCLFIPFAYIGRKINQPIIRKIILYLSKYSYIIFLLHHYVIQEIGYYFSNVMLDKYGTLIVYGLCWFVIIVLSRIIYHLNEKVLSFLEIKK